MELQLRHSTIRQTAVMEKGKRIHTKHTCCHCYTDRNLAKIENVEEKEERMINRKRLGRVAVTELDW